MGILAKVTLGQELEECFVVLMLNILHGQGTWTGGKLAC